MRVLIVTPWFPSRAFPISGTFIAEQARALAQVHNVRVLFPLVVPDGTQKYRDVEELDGYQVIRIGVPARRLFHQIDYSSAIAREVKDHGSQVIHAHVAVPAGFSSVLAGKFSGVPVVITEHRGPFAALFSTPRDKRKVRFALNRAAAVIAVSSALAGEMKQAAEITREIQVIPNVVDTDRFSPPSSNTNGHHDRKDFTLIFTGRVDDENKSLPTLLRALKLLREKNDARYNLRLIGEQSETRISETIARELGLEDWCAFVGPLSPDDLARELKSSDVFVLPSRLETFSVVAAEALATGKPVVATRCGGPEDFVNDETGRLVPVDDDAALAEGIRETCNNLAAYPPTRLAAYARDKFGFGSIVNQLTKVYESVIR